MAPPLRQTRSVQLLQNLATFRRGSSAADVSHYNVQKVFDVYANLDNRDLGGVASDVYKIVHEVESKCLGDANRCSRPG